MSRWSLPLLGLGLVISLPGCVSSGNPADMIPVGLRTTFAAEDRNAAPQKPMTAAQLLAKLRSETIPPSPEPTSAPASMPTLTPGAGAGGGPAAPILPTRDPSARDPSARDPSARDPSIEEGSRPALTELTLRFEGNSAEPRAEDGLRVQLAASRAARLGTVTATIKVGPAGVDRFTSVSLALKRGEAVRALLPETIAKSAQVAYAPSIEPGAARFDLR